MQAARAMGDCKYFNRGTAAIRYLQLRTEWGITRILRGWLCAGGGARPHQNGETFTVLGCSGVARQGRCEPTAKKNVAFRSPRHGGLDAPPNMLLAST